MLLNDYFGKQHLPLSGNNYAPLLLLKTRDISYSEDRRRPGVQLQEHSEFGRDVQCDAAQTAYESSKSGMCAVQARNQRDFSPN